MEHIAHCQACGHEYTGAEIDAAIRDEDLQGYTPCCNERFVDTGRCDSTCYHTAR